MKTVHMGLGIDRQKFSWHSPLRNQLFQEKLLHYRLPPARGKNTKMGAVKLSQERKKGQPKVTNEISDETGQYDARFLLWRQFCAEHGVPVETLPGDLTGETKEKWESLKKSRLKKQ